MKMQDILVILVAVLIGILVWGYIQYGDLLHFMRMIPGISSMLEKPAVAMEAAQSMNG